MDSDDPELPSYAAELVKRIADQDEIETTDSLPPWLPRDDYYEQHNNVIKVPQSTYEQLKRQKRPIFSHPTYHEGWRSLIYDPNTKKAQTLFEGGV